MNDDDDDGRTVVRGAPKIVKRTKGAISQPPTTISPAAVIKATLESARANRRDQLMPGPPSDLLEDSSDFAGSPKTPFMGLTPSPKVLDRGPAVFDRTAPPYEGPPTHRPPASYSVPPSSHAGGYSGAAPSAPVSYAGGAQYGQVPSAAASVPGVAPSVPAHFMTPQAPYGSNDPPATAVTSGHKVSGRPAISWAAALLACGLLVGVGAVAVMQSNDSVADTTASFVDPSRAAKAAQQAPVAQPATPVAVAAPTAPAAQAGPAPNAPLDPNAAPPGLLGASPVAAAPPPVAPAADPNVAVAPVVTTPPAQTAQAGVAFAPVAVPPASAAKPAAPAAAPPPAAAPAPAPRPTFAWKPAAPPAAAPAPKPAPPKPVAAAPADDEPVQKKSAAKSGRSTSKGGGETDDETKKALEALQKAQLESASSFGEK